MSTAPHTTGFFIRVKCTNSLVVARFGMRTSEKLEKMSENTDLCMSYLKKCRDTKKTSTGFSEMLIILQTEVAASGLPVKQLLLLVSVITDVSMSVQQRSSLIKCLVPIGKMSEKIVEDICLWLMSAAKNLPVNSGIAAVNWIVGLIDFGLIEIKTIDTFYDAFFYMLLKNQKLEMLFARLIYILTKPEDVTRRQVSRLLKLQSNYGKPRKHLLALLSLFKSYKPECVPERIQTTNIDSIWKGIPEALRLDLQEAAKRCSASHLAPTLQLNFLSAPTSKQSRSAKKQRLLIPMVGYINVGSSLSQERGTKSIFEVRSLEELGKHQLTLELPCNALSLLVNIAGCHVLTFSSSDYQSRFCYNLYNALENAFIIEVEKYSHNERDRLLSMTADLSRYMQQEIMPASRFLHKYIPFWNTKDHRDSILSLIEWMTIPSYPDFCRYILIPLQTMWESALVEVKCEILKTFQRMITNLFIKQGFPESRTHETALFLGNTQPLELEETMQLFMNFIQELITSGLYVETNNSTLLSEILTFYEQIAMLEERTDLPLLTVAPPAVIYGGLISHDIANLSRVSAILLRYRVIDAKLREYYSRDLFKLQIKTMNMYAKDLAKTLWYNRTLSGDKEVYLLATVGETITTDLQNKCDFEEMLNISNHYTVLPYKCSLMDIGLQIDMKEDYLRVAETYYPAVYNFLKIFNDQKAENRST
ncbi:centromere protein I-like isoform X1 [Athalia rosae]|uniref:centromere protein I-like isoform X1 n=2 Tax=Athalia rosae TaxID=37344 RepID=UPI0020346955|nr:centromere protein I-like isoform X1 [Athalia rosae]